MGFLRSIFGIDPPAPPGSGGGWTPTAAQRAAFLARHPMFAPHYQGRPIASMRGGAPLPPTYPPYHAAVPSSAMAPAPSVAMAPFAAGAFSPSTVATASQALASGFNSLVGTGGASGGGDANVSIDSPSSGVSADLSVGDSLNGELTIRHLPDGRIRIEHDAHCDMGCEGDVDHPGFAGDHTAPSRVMYHRTGLEDPFGILGEVGSFGCEEELGGSGLLASPEDGIWVGRTEPIRVEYHLPYGGDSMGPTHAPYNFGGDEMGFEGFGDEMGNAPMIHTAGMPTGPVGTGSGSFGDDMGFDDEFYDGGPIAMIFGSDVGCDFRMKG
jgi:hypothetical protein